MKDKTLILCTQAEWDQAILDARTEAVLTYIRESQPFVIADAVEKALAPIRALCDELRADQDRTWVSTIGDRLRDVLPTDEPTTWTIAHVPGTDEIRAWRSRERPTP